MRRAAWFVVTLAMLATGVVIGAVVQGFATAEISSGDRPVLVALPNPCRLVDTRAESTVGPKSSPLGPGEVYEIRGSPPGPTGECTEIPTSAQTLSLNVTALGATEQTFLTVWPDGPRPVASSLNPAPGQPPTPNAVKVRLSPDGVFNVFNARGEVHLIVDVDGYFEHHSHDDRSGVEFVKGEDLTPLEVNDSVVRTIDLDTSASGYAIVTASGYFRFDAAGAETVRCSITAGAVVINFAQLIIATSPVDTPAPALDPTTYESFSSTIVQPVPAGTTTFNLVCEEEPGDDVWVGDASLTAQFVPTRM